MREWLLLEHDRIELERAPCQHGLLARAPLDRLAAVDAIGEVLEQRAALERRSEQNARVALAVIEVDRHDQLASCQRLRLRENRAAAVGEGVAPLAAGSAAADAVRIGECKQQSHILVPRGR